MPATQCTTSRAATTHQSEWPAQQHEESSQVYAKLIAGPTEPEGEGIPSSTGPRQGGKRRHFNMQLLRWHVCTSRVISFRTEGGWSWEGVRLRESEFQPIATQGSASAQGELALQTLLLGQHRGEELLPALRRHLELLQLIAARACAARNSERAFSTSTSSRPTCTCNDMSKQV